MCARCVGTDQAFVKIVLNIVVISVLWTAETTATNSGTQPGRLAQPDEVAQVAAWLLSDGASYVSGETVVVDHGSLTR